MEEVGRGGVSGLDECGVDDVGDDVAHPAQDLEHVATIELGQGGVLVHAGHLPASVPDSVSEKPIDRDEVIGIGESGCGEPHCGSHVSMI